MVGYGAQALAIVALYALFALWSVAAWVCLRRASLSPGWSPAVVAGSLIAGPLSAGLMMVMLLWFTPRLESVVYLLLLYLLPLCISLAGWRHVFNGTMTAVFSRENILRINNLSFILGVGLFCIPVVLLAMQLTLLPLHGNDPLEYMQLGRAFFELRDARIYPILTALPQSGFIAPWTHPPTYGALISIAFMLQGSAAVAGAAKLIGLWFAIGTSLFAASLVYAADQRASWRVWLTPFAVISVPLSYELVQNAHIDAMRLASFTLAIGMMSHFIINGSRSAAVLAGLGIGYAMMSHSIGLLAPAIALPMLIVCWTRPAGPLLRGLAIIGLFASIMALAHYWRNTLIFGNPIQDSIPVWELPAMRVSEFLRVTRGLETVIDRLYIGILQPLMSASLLGHLLPIGLLLVLPFVVYRMLLQFPSRALWNTLFKVRGDRAAMHFTLAVAGFFLLILLSALAGSDLAVKNARYILTIIPIAIVAVMIGIGKAVDDDSFMQSARHVWSVILSYIDALRRLGPARWHPAPRGVPLVDDGRDWRQELTRYTGFAIVVLAAFIVQAEVVSSLRIFNGYLRVYYAGGALPWNRLLESEQMKRNGSLLDDALVETFVRNRVPNRDSVLTFRQASYGFYTSPKFVFHADHALVDLFKLDSVDALHQALLKRNIRWIYTPNYALPEINNSPFAPLLIDQDRVRPIIRSAGWALYSLRADKLGVETQPLGKASPIVRQGVPLYATTEDGSGMVDGRRASLTLDQSTGVAELKRDRGFIKQLGRWDVLLSRPASTRLSPVESNAADFLVGNDPVKISALLSGRGLAEVVVEYLSYPPVLRQGAVEGAVDLRSHPPQLVREIVWSGVLAEKPQAIGGWLTPVPSPADGEQVVGYNRGARLIFRLRDGDVLKVHEWQAASFDFPEDRRDNTTIASAVSSGWLFSPTSIHPQRGYRMRTPGAETGSQAQPIFSPLGADRLTMQPIVLAPPAFTLPQANSTLWNDAARRLALDEWAARGDLQVEVRTQLRGYAQVVPALSVVCAVTRPEQSAELSQWTSGGTATTGEKTLTRTLPSLQLWGDKVEPKTWRSSLPCVPRSVRLLLQNKSQPHIIVEEILRSPERQRFSHIDVHAISASLVSMNGLSGSQAAQVVIPLENRSLLVRPSRP